MEAAKIWEEAVVIPTYEIGEADKNPMFLEKRVYQGSTGKIYPYPSIQEISREKHDKAWKAVFLENAYLRVMVLPELGGRIQRAYDKTNGYDFVYYNSVIKPALVGLCGPWISGGIEFNWPQHHRPTTYSPVDYELRTNGDGSVTVLLNDVDLMNGTKAVTSFTLYADKAYIEVGGQLYNRTALPQTFLWWANPAVAVNDYTQSIFPPDVHNVYDHGKRAVSRFPIATGEYYKHDYSAGVDISRYKNIPVPTSYMAEKSDYDFVGGYDYQKQAGLLHVADHHVSPGKKQWTWGCGDFGKAWDRNLTDSDGPYIELMTGVYCDNQPDFTWLKPYEEKKFKQYFMPYKAVGQVKNATIHAALNSELTKEGLSLCVYATERYENAVISVEYDGSIIYEEKATISPTDIYKKTIAEISTGAANGTGCIDEYKMRVTVRASDGKTLVSYQAVDQGIPELAEPAKAARAPADIMTNEELFLTAQHIEQYRHATFLPDPYYKEGLKRDNGDSRINNAYGLLLLRRGDFTTAEKHFRAAIARLTRMNPNPYNSEAYYNLGLALFYQARYDDAYDAFFKATWSNEQQEMSFYYLAALAARKQDWLSALEFADKGLVKNSHNVKARALKAAILRELGRTEEAAAWISENLAVDSFDYVSRFEQAFASGDNAAELLSAIESRARGNHETYLAAARDYAEAGFYSRALSVLAACPQQKPLIAYYTGYYRELCTAHAESACAKTSAYGTTALEAYKAAEALLGDYCFPNKLEDIAVLKAAMRANPSAAKAPYYLGCLYYDKLQYEDAIALWEQSAAHDEGFATVHRNLAIAYYNKRDDKQMALLHMEKAFACDTSDARVFLERDQLYQKLQKSAEERLAQYKAHIDLIQKRDDLYTEYVTVLNLTGAYEEAHKAITSHLFQTWEGAEGKITTQFKTALLEMAKQALSAGTADGAKKAAALLEESLSYPQNLGEGRLEGTKDNNLYYTLALAYEKLGETEKAHTCLQNATLGASEPAGIMYYYDQPADMILYQGLALQKLGKQPEANARFYMLIDYGEAHLRETFKMDYFAVSMPDMSVFDADMTERNRAHCYYLMGLGKLGLGKKAEAAADFASALAIEASHQNAALYKQMAEKAE